MKKIKLLFNAVVIFQILFLLYSCSENPTLPKEEPCPDILIVPKPPYDSPIWHPNGNIIAFNHTPLDSITYPYGKHCIGIQHFNYDSLGFWLINIDGTNMRKVLPFELQTPVWSPDGNWTVFVKNANIYKMPFDITEEKFDTTHIEQLTFEGGNYFPNWSLDGSFIVFDSNNESPNGMHFIWKMKNDGSEKKRIAFEPEVGEIRAPNWALDDKIFHIRYSPNFNSCEIYSMGINGNDTTRLTFNDYTEYYPKSSSNNKILAYTSNDKLGNPTTLLAMNLLNNNIIKLTSNGIHKIFNWSPNGEKIVYTQHDFSKWSYDNGVLWIIDVNTGTEHQLTFNTKE